MTAPQRILLSHIYFPPASKPYGLMLEHMAHAFVREGYAVEVFTSLLPEDAAAARAGDARLAASGIPVTRVRLRGGGGRGHKLRSALRYSVALAWYVARRRPDVATVASFPPLMTAFCVGLAARWSGTKVVYHVLDIHPEITAPKVSRALRGIYRVVGMLMSRLTLRLVSAVVTLSEDMRAVLVARGASSRSTVVINTLSLASLEPAGSAAPGPEPLASAGDRFVVVFAGNMGAFQALDLVAEFVRKAVTEIPVVEFLFVGDGIRRAWLMNEVASSGDGRVRFLDFVPFSELAPILRTAQMGLVSLDQDSTRYAYPSKIVTYLGVGLPLLCAMDTSSAIAREIRQNELGVCFDAASLDQGVRDLSRLCAGGAAYAAMRQNSRDYFARSFAPRAYYDGWFRTIRHAH